MTAARVLLAGTTGLGEQNHQSEMWAPALRAAGLEVAAIWSPPGAAPGARERASKLATDLGVEVTEANEIPATDGIIACLRGDDLVAAVEAAARADIPILVDKPSLETTETLQRLAEAVPGARIVTGFHLSSHPGYARALRAVRAAEIGLLRAAAVDIVVSLGDGLPAEGDLRNLAVYAVDMIRQATGPATVRLQAHSSSQGDSWTFLGKTERDVVVNAHVSRTRNAGEVGMLRGSIRLVGTHGTVLVDLLRPELEIATPGGRTSRGVGADSIAVRVDEFAAAMRGGRTTKPADLVMLSSALDGIAASAQTHTATTISW